MKYEHKKMNPLCCYRQKIIDIVDIGYNFTNITTNNIYNHITNNWKY